MKNMVTSEVSFHTSSSSLLLSLYLLLLLLLLLLLCYCNLYKLIRNVIVVVAVFNVISLLLVAPLPRS